MISRREFLRRLGFGSVAAAAAATGVLDIERLLWMPGEKTLFLPTLQEMHAINTFEVSDWIAAEYLRILKQNISIVPLFNRSFNRSFV